MADPVTNQAEPHLYRLLKSIQPPSLSEAAWARKAHVSSSFFQDVRKGTRPRADNLEKVVAAAGYSIAQFYALEAPVRTEVAGTGISGTNEVRRAFFGEDPVPAMPLLGTAVGAESADIEEDVELTELHLGEVLDYLARPLSLQSDKDAYALTIVGDSMSPRFEPGERVAVSPRAPVAIGDDVIVQLRAREGEDERVKMVLIKRLVRRTASHVELRQFNPEKTFRIEARRVAALHKVAGNLF